MAIDRLKPGEAHLHLLRLGPFDLIPEEALLHRYGWLLSSDEQARHKRPTIEKRRREVLLTRALVRTVLSRYADIDPRDWRFGAAERGRPFIAGQHKVAFDFNLAHTTGLIVCLVSGDPAPGVDVEAILRRADMVEVAGHFFAPVEAAAVRDVTEDRQRRERFFAYWTLKEAYIKARGLGLSLPLDAFWFSLEDGKDKIAFDDRIDDDPAAWRFARLSLSAEHRCAVAVKTTAPLDLHLFENPLS